jgi:nucleoside-diphosphate kinase
MEIAGTKIVRVSKELAEEHYAELKGQPFFQELVDYIMGKFHDRLKVMALVYHGEDAVQKVRSICGATNPEEAEPNSIRGAYGRITTTGIYENVIHSSASALEAEREIKLWFSPRDMVYHIFPVEEVEKTQTKELVWA